MFGGRKFGVPRVIATEVCDLTVFNVIWVFINTQGSVADVGKANLTVLTSGANVHTSFSNIVPFPAMSRGEKIASLEICQKRLTLQQADETQAGSQSVPKVSDAR